MQTYTLQSVISLLKVSYLSDSKFMMLTAHV